MSEDRNIVLSDEKSRIIDFEKYRYTAPEVGIYEGELRYFALNSAWYPIIIGWIDHLAQAYAWSNAEYENDHAIQQILKFEQGVDMPIIDCGEIEDCIENSPTIINIINKGGSGYNPENAEKPIEEGETYPSAGTPVIEPDDCGDSDKNKLWGAISSFIDFCHNLNLDLFQKISQVSSQADLLAIVIEAIPLIETLPADEGVEVAAWFLNNLGTGYQGEVTTVSLYELKCELFCASVANDCEFTIEVAMDYFASNMGIPSISTSSTFIEITAALADALSLVGNEWFSAITFLQLSIASLGETFVQPHGLDYYLKSAQAGALSGDSAWQVWCTACAEEPSGEWLLVLDFANDYVKVADEFVVRNAFTLLKDDTQTGNPILKQAYQKGAIFERDENSEAISKKIIFQSPVGLSHARINWRCSKGTDTVTARVSTPLYSPPSVTTTSSSFAWTSPAPITAVGGTFNAVSQVNIGWSLLLSSNRGESELRYIELRGQGALPVFAS